MSKLESMSSIVERLQQRYRSGNIKPLTPKERAYQKSEYYNASKGDRNLIDGYNCDICHNKAMISIIRVSQTQQGEDVYDEYFTDCKCVKIRRSIMRMKRSGMEALLEKYRFESYTVTEPWQEAIKTKAINFAKNPQELFFIGGQSGSGKTHLCTGIARKILFDGKELRYMLWRDEAVKLKSAINDEEKYQSIIEPLKRVDVLYIDDFLKMPRGENAASPSTAELSIALEIINNRYNSKLTTIISSEWTLNEIIEFDEALGGRLYEMCGAEYCVSIKKDKSRNYRIKNIVEI